MARDLAEGWRKAGGNGGAWRVRSFPKIEFQQTGLAENPMDAVAVIFEESAPVNSPVALRARRAEAQRLKPVETNE